MWAGGNDMGRLKKGRGGKIRKKMRVGCGIDLVDGWVRCEKVGCFMSSCRRSARVAERHARAGGTSAHRWWRERLPNSANYGFYPLTVFLHCLDMVNMEKT